MSLETDHRADSATRVPLPGALRVGLVNNMPDSALEATETQFTRLLEAAAGELPVQLRFYYLPGINRGAAVRERIEKNYWHIRDLDQEPPDALIVTGMEPGAGSLTEEPYWESFVQLLHWASAHTVSSIWSCLAAHAAAQCLHGVQRRRRAEKLSGVFEHQLLAGHPLLAGVSEPFRLPHSRWNDLPVEELKAAGYTVLSSSATTGADTFIEQRRSLFVCFQGHPEYEETSLLKEYRRDVGRFLRGQQASYPLQPENYFSAAVSAELETFRARALAAPREELLAQFPAIAAGGVRNTWQAPAARIYRNWLTHVAGARAPRAARPARRAGASRS
jgi:homoserine O-succinyltransferase/O-acetyltransferase